MSSELSLSALLLFVWLRSQLPPSLGARGLPAELSSYLTSQQPQWKESMPLFQQSQ